MEASNPDSSAQAAGRKRSWKSLLLVDAGFGAGVVIMGTVIMGVFFWFMNRPKGWDTRTIVVSGQAHIDKPDWFETPPQKPDVFDQLTAKHGAYQGGKVDIVFDVRNNGTSDYTFSRSASVMLRIPSTNALTSVSDTISLPSDYFIPAREKTKVTVTANLACSVSTIDWKGCIWDDMRGGTLVFFDHANHIEVEAPLTKL